MRGALACILLLALTVPAVAAQRSAVLYLDGARYTAEVSAAKGVAEIVLPAGMLRSSLRVRPLDGTRIERVAVMPARPDRKTVQELDRLGERKELLQDRLKALQTREEIFRAAARSQSGKAPRKTKVNPDPMASIRKGTAFAIAQLEEVYRLRRQAEKEITSLDDRLAALRADTAAGGHLVRVRLGTPKGAVAVSWSVAGTGWTPRYDVRFDGSGSAQVTLRAGLPSGASGPVSVSVATMNSTAAEVTRPVPGDGDVVALYRLPVSQEQVLAAPLTALVATLSNTTGKPLPAGDADGYWRGEYLGTILLPAVAPGGSVSLRYSAPSGDLK